MVSELSRAMTVQEVALYLHVSRATIYRLLKRGELPGFRIGSDWRFNVEAIDQWLLDQQNRVRLVRN